MVSRIFNHSSDFGGIFFIIVVLGYIYIYWSFQQFWEYFGHFRGYEVFFFGSFFQVSRYFSSFQRCQCIFAHFRGVGGILAILEVSKLFGNFRGFESILVIFKIQRYFNNFQRFQEYFGNLRGFKSILFILKVLRGISVISARVAFQSFWKLKEYFDHFRGFWDILEVFSYFNNFLIILMSKIYIFFLI